MRHLTMLGPMIALGAGLTDFTPARTAMQVAPAAAPVHVLTAPGCFASCGAALPPCRVGRRWYGPYGYVCYRPEPYYRPSWLSRL